LYFILKKPGTTIFLSSAIFQRLPERQRETFLSAMEAFLKEFGDYYGYPDGPKNIQEIRDTEFKRLDKGLFFFVLF